MAEPRRGLRAAVAFLTPVGEAVEPNPDALWWFPAVGALIGLTVGAVWWLAGRAWSPAVAAVLAVGADLALTGLLHVDGLCDTADGLLAPLDRERRLAVMASPEIGAFGVAVCGVTLLARWAALASLRPAPLLVAGVWAASRTWMAAIIMGVPYARREGGLARAFLGTERRLASIATIGSVAALVLAAGWRPGVGPAAVVAGTLGAFGVVALARARVGGFTGDVLGAAGMVGETVGLIVAAARW